MQMCDVCLRSPKHVFVFTFLAQCILNAYEATPMHLIIVSNEVGLGIVPAYPLGRVYRDALGRINQRLATYADEVLFMVAGLPMTVKKAIP